jgi:hypothetical protein
MEKSSAIETVRGETEKVVGFGTQSVKSHDETPVSKFGTGWGPAASDNTGTFGGGLTERGGRGAARGGRGGCYNCGGDGHRSNECSQPRRPPPTPCWKCNEVGHWANDCPKGGEGGGRGGRGGGKCFISRAFIILLLEVVVDLAVATRATVVSVVGLRAAAVVVNLW